MEVPIKTVHLFPILEQKLMEFLCSLKRDDWSKPTCARLWTVKDIAAHLLDGNIRTLSMSRDRYFGESPSTSSYQGLVEYLNQLNADWVKAIKRVSPAVLIELLEVTGREYTEHMHSLDPFEPSVFPVAWAGEEVSMNWFNIAREYTEKWHHQQQMREAVSNGNDKELLSTSMYYPVLDTFMRALPYTYRNTPADDGAIIKIVLTGDAGGNWYLIRKKQEWKLTKENQTPIACTVLFEAANAWKLFTKGLTAAEKEGISVIGDITLGRPFFSIVAVMA